MKISKKNKSVFSKYLIYGAVVAILFAAIGWSVSDIWLASTQWLLVSVVLALFGIYMKMN